MKIALIVYNQLTLLDLIGFFDPITRLRSMGFIPDLTWDFCSYESNPIDNHGFPIKIDHLRNNLMPYDMIFVPGGFASRKLLEDSTFISWLQTAIHVPTKVSVCTGSLLLGAAGFLTHRKATTHFDEYGTLSTYCNTVIKDEVVVEDGDCITAGAVASSITLGLYVCEKFAGKAARDQISKRMGL